jgi:uncharacterized RDD family membrane protein YckC
MSIDDIGKRMALRVISLQTEPSRLFLHRAWAEMAAEVALRTKPIPSLAIGFTKIFWRSAYANRGLCVVGI